MLSTDRLQSSWAAGKTKVFLKDELIELLEEARSEKLRESAKVIKAAGLAMLRGRRVLAVGRILKAFAVYQLARAERYRQT